MYKGDPHKVSARPCPGESDLWKGAGSLLRSFQVTRQTAGAAVTAGTRQQDARVNESSPREAEIRNDKRCPWARLREQQILRLEITLHM